VIVYYLLDTNTVSYIVRGRSAHARAELAALGQDEVACISSITEAEIWYGLAKNANAHALRVAVEAFLAKIKVLPWDRDEARAYGELRARLEAAGKSLGNLDTLIAAQAISAGAVLVTNDRALLEVRGLRGAVNWATDI
jgi:tRNA(fMet)-specific endonuclease VapC